MSEVVEPTLEAVGWRKSDKGWLCTCCTGIKGIRGRLPEDREYVVEGRVNRELGFRVKSVKPAGGRRKSR